MDRQTAKGPGPKGTAEFAPVSRPTASRWQIVRQRRPGVAKPRTEQRGRGAWVVLLAGISVGLGALLPQLLTAQQVEETGRPRMRMMMKAALEDFKRGDYEAAAKSFATAQANQNELSPTEQRNLKKFIQQNNEAIVIQREGTAQVHLAEEALHNGKTLEAARLVRVLAANQYLTPADRQALTRINEGLRQSSAAGKMGEAGPRNDEKSLLNLAREALKRNDPDAAEKLVMDAEKVAPWMRSPWADTPAKVRREIASLRSKQALPPPPPVANNNTSEKKEGAGLVSGIKTMFSSKRPDEKKDGLTQAPDLPPVPPSVGPTNITPPPLPSPPPSFAKNDTPKTTPAVTKQPEGPPVRQTTYGSDANAHAPSGEASKAEAHKLIKEAYRSLEANDLENAHRLALRAKDLHPDLEWWEENPAKLLDDIQRRAAAKTAAPGANANTKPLPQQGTDARTLVKEARTYLQQDKLDEAEKSCSLAAAAQSKGWGLFEDSPDKLRADIQKARTRPRPRGCRPPHD